MDIIAEAKEVFNIEIEALEKTRDALDGTFIEILSLITRCKGKVIVTGMGKSGHIARKISATMASLGTPSFFLHPAEALHGDLGMVSSDDIVIAISYSGESEEITRILPNLKLIGAQVIAISGKENSSLATHSDIAQILPQFEEACHLGLAPTSSTTVALCYGDALAVVASQEYGFKDLDFGKFHPAGALGKKLLIRVCDLMSSNEKNALISDNSSLKEAIVELSKKGLGMVNIVNEDNQLKGIITDGDLRRLLEKGADIYNLRVQEIMTKNPICIKANKMAVEALHIMKLKNISCMPVLKEETVCGTIRLQDIISAGIIG